MGGPRGYFHDGMMWSEAKNIEQSRSDELLSSRELLEGQNSMNVSVPGLDEGGMRKKQEQSGSRGPLFTQR